MGFNALVKEISPKLQGITHKLNGKFLFFNEDDLYQEAVFDLWQRYNNGRLCDKTESYIVQSCAFFLKNYIRKSYKRIDKNSIRFGDMLNDEDKSKDIDDFLFLESNNNDFEEMQTALILEEIKNLLSDKESHILNLSIEGFTIREIGQQLGISHVMVIKIKKKISIKCQRFKI